MSLALAAIMLGLGACHHDEAVRTEQPGTTCKPLAFVAGEHDNDRYDLFRLSSDGHLTLVTTDLSTFDPSVAPDGSWVAAARAGPADWMDIEGYSDSQIVVLQSDGSVEARVSKRTGWMDHSPSVAPSGDNVAFLRTDMTGGGESQLVLAARDGKVLRVVASGAFSGGLAWKPDGSAIAVNDQDPVTYKGYLAIIDLKSGASQRWPNVAGGNPVFSPDGTHVLLSDSGYQTPGPIVEVELASGRQRTVSPPAGANWTNANYADPDGASLRVLRFEQTVELLPQRLEVVDWDGKVHSSTVLDIVPLVGGDNGRTLLTELSTSDCFATD